MGDSAVLASGEVMKSNVRSFQVLCYNERPGATSGARLFEAIIAASRRPHAIPFSDEAVKLLTPRRVPELRLIGSPGRCNRGGMKAATLAEARGHQVTLGLGKETEGVKRRAP